MTQIFVPSDVTGSEQRIQGSDGRMNVSSRSDERSYYVSRDDSEAYSLVFDDTTGAAGTYVVYWKNDHTDKHLVVEAIGVNCVQLSTLKVHVVTGTAAAGSALTAACLNRAVPKVAQATCRGDDSITGLTSVVVVDQVQCPAAGHEEIRLKDRLRLGPGQAMALEVDKTASAGIVEGVIFAFYE